MGQQEVSTSDNITIKVTQLLKLASDGENWLTYHKRVLNAATAQGLRHHLVGTALKPSTVIGKNGKFYLKYDDPDPLSEEALDKHETSVDSWEQKEAQVHDLIYNTCKNLDTRSQCLCSQIAEGEYENESFKYIRFCTLL